jgi:hypothetical protein
MYVLLFLTKCLFVITSFDLSMLHGVHDLFLLLSMHQLFIQKAMETKFFE